MIEDISLGLLFRIASAIIVLWGASVAMRRLGTIWPFLPLFVYFIGLAATAAAEFYEIFITDLQTVFDAIFLIFYIWIFIVMIMLARKNHTDTNI